MHVKNGANQNMSNHKLTGAKCQLIRRFWLEIMKVLYGEKRILRNTKTIKSILGLAVEHRGPEQEWLSGIMQNWQRTVNNSGVQYFAGWIL